MYSGASVETTGTGDDMSERLWWAIFGLGVLVWISAIITGSRLLTVVTVLIAVVLAVGTWHKYGRKEKTDEDPVAKEK